MLPNSAISEGIATTTAACLLTMMRGDEQLMASLIFGAGLTLGECLRLRVKNVSLPNKTLRVRSKKPNGWRLVSIPDALLEDISEQIEQRDARAKVFDFASERLRNCWKGFRKAALSILRESGISKEKRKQWMKASHDDEILFPVDKLTKGPKVIRRGTPEVGTQMYYIWR